MKPTIGGKYIWSKKKDTVLVREIETDIAYVEVINCDDKKYVVGQKMWVFIVDLKM